LNDKLRHRLCIAILLSLAGWPLLVFGQQVGQKNNETEAVLQSKPLILSLPSPYQDNVMKLDEASSFAEEDENETKRNDGPSRSFYVEAVLGRSERGDVVVIEQGVSLGGFRSTDAWGDWSFDLSGARSRGSFGVFPLESDQSYSSGWTGTVWQRNFALNNTWLLDNGIGVINTPAVDLMRNQYRFTLPTVPFLGIRSDARSDRMQVVSAYGRLGTFDGSRVLGFVAGSGHVATLAMQNQLSPTWSYAAAYINTQGALAPDYSGGSLVGSDRQSQAIWSALRWQQGNHSVQLNVQASHGTTDGDVFDNAVGVWIDASSNIGRHRHNYGVFRMDPGLSWGAWPINSNVSGGYYRWAYQYGEWSWNLGGDYVSPTSKASNVALTPTTVYVTGYARRQVASRWGMGMSAAARQSTLPMAGSKPQQAYSMQWFVDKTSKWGQSRAQIDLSRHEQGRLEMLSFDHSFLSVGTNRVSASLSWARDTLNLDWPPSAQRSESLQAALTGSRALGDNLSLDGTIRYLHGTGGSAQRSTDVNLGLNWAITPRLKMTATYFQSSGAQRAPIILDPLADPELFLRLPKNKTAFLSLRYDFSGGRPYGVLGAAPGAVVATGRIAGVVFLDVNKNGLRDASEEVVPNITLLLDGRYSVQTDINGKYVFDRVAVGSHRVTVQDDNLPLPWEFSSQTVQRDVEVSVRDTTILDVPAISPL